MYEPLIQINIGIAGLAVLSILSTHVLKRIFDDYGLIDPEKIKLRIVELCSGINQSSVNLDFIANMRSSLDLLRDYEAGLLLLPYVSKFKQVNITLQLIIKILFYVLLLSGIASCLAYLLILDLEIIHPYITILKVFAILSTFLGGILFLTVFWIILNIWSSVYRYKDFFRRE